MSQAVSKAPDLDEDDAAELALLTAAVEEARAERASIQHEEARAWLIEVADGRFDAH
ncbi:MAG TPA: hypothetical protein VGI79_01285 [Caulobacteraceae bacterium]|jgi:hypothetical protein